MVKRPLLEHLLEAFLVLLLIVGLAMALKGYFG